MKNQGRIPVYQSLPSIYSRLGTQPDSHLIRLLKVLTCNQFIDLLEICHPKWYVDGIPFGVPIQHHD
jgi:hypothetical protein